MQQEIFKVEVNEEGVYWLRRFARLALLMIFLTILINCVNLFEMISYIIQSNRDNPFSKSLRIKNIVSFSVGIINFIFQIIQISLYRIFSIRGLRAVNAGDSSAYNRSFRLLFYQSVFFLLQLLMAAIYYVYLFYGDKF